MKYRSTKERANSFHLFLSNLAENANFLQSNGDVEQTANFATIDPRSQGKILYRS